MVWKNDWPVIGVDADGDGCGEPVLMYKKPIVSKSYTIVTPPESDEFDSLNLGLQWQWHANPQITWSYQNPKDGYLRLYSVYTEGAKNLWDLPNLLLQKLPAPAFTATAKVSFLPDKRYKGERAGFVMMGDDYAMLAIENTKDGLFLQQIECLKAFKGNAEQINEQVQLASNALFVRVVVKENARCTFAYSIDGANYTNIGKEFTAKQGRWIGAKLGFFCQRPKWFNDGGWMDIEWYRVEK